MKRESRSDTSGSTSPLFQVGLACPNRRIVGHVVVSREDLHLRFTRINHEHDIVNCHAALSNVRRENHLKIPSVK